jgi:hypothetical protein
MIARHQHVAVDEIPAIPDPAEVARQMCSIEAPPPPQNIVADAPGAFEFAPQHGAHPSPLGEGGGVATYCGSCFEAVLRGGYPADMIELIAPLSQGFRPVDIPGRLG